MFQFRQSRGKLQTGEHIVGQAKAFKSGIVSKEVRVFIQAYLVIVHVHDPSPAADLNIFI